MSDHRVTPSPAGTHITPPARSQAFYRFNGRLALFQKSAADKDHWEQRWLTGDLDEYLRSYRTGKLDEFEDVFRRFLPKQLPILEAGCGKGQLVAALAARGYPIEGLDYAEATVRRIRAAAPDLKVRVGDIYKLDVPDETYGGYISIGLFEHNPDGPQAALRETRRVLHPKGVALISVPYLNSRRSDLLLRATTASGTETADGLSFYQYYFERSEFQKHVELAGLRVVECFPYGVHTGLVRDSAFWQWLGRSRLFVWPLHHRFIRYCAKAPSWLRFKAAHMLMFVCQRNEGT